MAKIEACQMRKERETAESKCKDVEQENNQLKKELEELRATFNAQKKELEELRAGFAAKKNELEEDYHKQVDDMFFFGYQCCIRKNDITHDIPSYPSNDEDVAINYPAQGDKDSDAVGPFDRQ